MAARRSTSSRLVRRGKRAEVHVNPTEKHLESSEAQVNQSLEIIRAIPNSNVSGQWRKQFAQVVQVCAGLTAGTCNPSPVCRVHGSLAMGSPTRVMQKLIWNFKTLGVATTRLKVGYISTGKPAALPQD